MNLSDIAKKTRDIWFELSDKKVNLHTLQKVREGAQVQRYVPKTERAKNELGLDLRYAIQESLRKTLLFNWKTLNREIT